MPVVKINRAFPDALCFNHLLLWHEKSTLTYYWLKCFVKQLLNYLSVRQTVKETIGVGVNEKAALSSDKNCPFVYINFDFTLVNKVAFL